MHRKGAARSVAWLSVSPSSPWLTSVIVLVFGGLAFESVMAADPPFRLRSQPLEQQVDADQPIVHVKPIRVDVADTVFQVYDITMPPDGKQPSRPRYLSTWCDRSADELFVFDRVLLSPSDVGQAIFALEADLGVDGQALEAADKSLALAVQLVQKDTSNNGTWIVATREAIQKLIGIAGQSPATNGDKAGGTEPPPSDCCLVTDPCCEPPAAIIIVTDPQGSLGNLSVDTFIDIVLYDVDCCPWAPPPDHHCPCCGVNCNDGNPCTTDSCSGGSCNHVADPDPCCGSSDRCCGGGGACCGSVDPCCDTSDPCCGDTNRCCNDDNPCCDSPDPCCNSSDPCCGDSNRCCNDDNPCCGSEDPCCNSDDLCCGDPNRCCNDDNPCCGSPDPCCNSNDPCCGNPDPCCNPDNPCCENTDPCDPVCGDPCAPGCINCDDGDSCTIDGCTLGSCWHEPVTDPCDPDCGDPCLCNPCLCDPCLAGCLDCDDGDPCTTDSCSNGSCHNDPICPGVCCGGTCCDGSVGAKASLSSCCGAPDPPIICCPPGACCPGVCIDGACCQGKACPIGTEGEEVCCDACDQCAASGCCPQGGAVRPDGVCCDDGDPCTTDGWECADSSCATYNCTVAPACDDGNPCTDDICTVDACGQPVCDTACLADCTTCTSGVCLNCECVAASATLVTDPDTIPAKSSWPAMPTLYFSDINVTWDPPQCEGTLAIVDVVGDNGYFPPNDGTLARIDAGNWKYTAFDEPMTEKRPERVLVWIGAMQGSQELTRIQVKVRTAFNWFVSGHQHGPGASTHSPDVDDYSNAYQLIRWKYASCLATTGGSFGTVDFVLDQLVDCAGKSGLACTTIFDNVTFATGAFNKGENAAASIIGHELTHTVGVLNQSECTAYTWEITTQPCTVIYGDYWQNVQQMQAQECAP